MQFVSPLGAPSSRGMALIEAGSNGPSALKPTLTSSSPMRCAPNLARDGTCALVDRTAHADSCSGRSGRTATMHDRPPPAFKRLSDDERAAVRWSPRRPADIASSCSRSSRSSTIRPSAPAARPPSSSARPRGRPTRTLRRYSTLSISMTLRLSATHARSRTWFSSSPAKDRCAHGSRPRSHAANRSGATCAHAQPGSSVPTIRDCSVRVSLAGPADPSPALRIWACRCTRAHRASICQ